MPANKVHVTGLHFQKRDRFSSCGSSHRFINRFFPTGFVGVGGGGKHVTPEGGELESLQLKW